MPGDPGQNSYFTGNSLSNTHAHIRKNKKEKLHRVPPNIVLHLDLSGDTQTCAQKERKD